MECNQCRLLFSAFSLPRHLESQHGVYQSKVFEEEYLAGGPLVVYKCWQLEDGKSQCPFPDCSGKLVSKWGMRWHFCVHHPSDLVSLPNEGAVVIRNIGESRESRIGVS